MTDSAHASHSGPSAETVPPPRSPRTFSRQLPHMCMDCGATIPVEDRPYFRFQCRFCVVPL